MLAHKSGSYEQKMYMRVERTGEEEEGGRKEEQINYNEQRDTHVQESQSQIVPEQSAKGERQSREVETSESQISRVWRTHVDGLTWTNVDEARTLAELLSPPNPI